jgi:hypothetical protein
MDAGSQRKRWSRAYETDGRESEFRQFRTECCGRTIPVSLMSPMSFFSGSERVDSERCQFLLIRHSCGEN